MDITIVLPCFNERENVEIISRELMPVVERLRRDKSVELIFVDDGSTDGTGDLLECRLAGDLPVRVVRHERNRGLGAALRTGFQHANGRLIVVTDSDASYPFARIPPLLEQMRAGVDIVTASCYHPLGGIDNVPAYRVLLSRTASLMYRVLVNRHVCTYTCMFRAYRREVVESVSFESDGFLAVTELLVNALLAGYAVREMPCTLRVRRYGSSKARVMGIVWSHLGFQWCVLRARCLQTLRGARVTAEVQPSNRGRGTAGR